ncbi:MAG: hypothetical protein O7F76_08675 [Planctomycetota bacterium]|nr:hypothetical protein [Planctomycetota bacterium]MCZ6816746.1 hypothetical protein [Planctomycetota bacterium]
METGILQFLTELYFTFIPLPGTLQVFELLASILNAIFSGLGIDINFVALLP